MAFLLDFYSLSGLPVLLGSLPASHPSSLHPLYSVSWYLVNLLLEAFPPTPESSWLCFRLKMSVSLPMVSRLMRCSVIQEVHHTEHTHSILFKFVAVTLSFPQVTLVWKSPGLAELRNLVVKEQELYVNLLHCFKILNLHPLWWEVKFPENILRKIIKLEVSPPLTEFKLYPLPEITHREPSSHFPKNLPHSRFPHFHLKLLNFEKLHFPENLKLLHPVQPHPKNILSLLCAPHLSQFIMSWT